MRNMTPVHTGRHFLQIPGPTNVPDRVLRAIDFPTMDHRSPDFAALGKATIAGMKRIFKSTRGEVVIYPASGTGAWEAALVNTLAPGDRVLAFDNGHFSQLFASAATNLNIPDTISWMPNSTAMTSSVSLGQTSTTTPAASVMMP